MKKAIKIILIGIALVVFAVIINCFRSENLEAKNGYNHSRLGGWPRNDLNGLVEKLCEKNGIEYDEDYKFASWTALVCPSCGQGNSLLTDKDDTTYCAQCGHPIGIDWGIRKKEYRNVDISGKDLIHEEPDERAKAWDAEWKSRLLTSDYEWPDYDLNGFSKALCKKQDVDYSEFWIIACPNCTGGAILMNSQDGFYVYHFISDCIPVKLYCGNCYYPAGSDWTLKSPDEFTKDLHHEQEVVVVTEDN